jgi:two-component system, OmpR family, phosphate regulon sensor histidine kinase PhoR
MNDKKVRKERPKSRYEQDLLFYKFAISSLPVGILSVDSDLKITGFNPWAERITGYAEHEVLGRYCGDVLHGGMCDMHCPLRTVLRREKPMVGIETTIQKREGVFIPVRMSTAGLFDQRERLIGGIESFQDISHLKNLERERNNIISMIAHDMKSPIISIHGFAHRLLTRANADKQKQYLEIIEKESTRLEALINEFLELSRLQAGKLTLNLSSTSLDKELYELFDLYQHRASEKGLRLELRSDEPLPIIEADSHRLRRALSNLLDNAIKFSQSGGTITLLTREREGEVVVEIRDQGVGIDSEDIYHVFDAFHRGKEPGTQEQGFGLGLAGVKAIIEGHGGRVQVRSEPGKGSTFFVFLPKTPSHSDTGIHEETLGDGEPGPDAFL